MCAAFGIGFASLWYTGLSTRLRRVRYGAPTAANAFRRNLIGIWVLLFSSYCAAAGPGLEDPQKTEETEGFYWL